jgi:hypothetical protein
MSVPDEPTPQPPATEPVAAEPAPSGPAAPSDTNASAPTPSEPASAAGTPASFPEYGVYRPADEEPPPPPGDPLRGILAGLGVAVVGAILWAVVVYLTKYEVGLLAVVIGYGVGYVVHRVGKVASQGMAITSAALAAAGILLGFVLTTVAAVAQVAGVGFFDAVNLISDNNAWGTALGDSVNGLDWLFLAVGAFAAWRLVAGQRRPPRRT